MGKKKLFNKEQEEFILTNYMNMSNKELANELGCEYSRSQINSWLQHRGIKRLGKGHSTKTIFTDLDIEFIKNNYAKMTSPEIGKILGFTKRQIDGKVAKLNLPNKKRNINHDYFNEIDSPLKAYFLGFIYADGWVVYNSNNCNYELGMELQSQDKYILDKLNEELGNQNYITHSNPKIKKMSNGQIIHGGHSDIIRIYSKNIVEKLMNHGIKTNKTKKEDFPIVSDDLFFDFLRGFIDGDGCYYVNNGNTYMHITSASIPILEYIKNKLYCYKIKTQIYTENNKKHRLMCTNYKSMNELISRLYYEDGLLFLERKYEKIKNFLGFAV